MSKCRYLKRIPDKFWDEYLKTSKGIVLFISDVMVCAGDPEHKENPDCPKKKQPYEINRRCWELGTN